MLFSWLKLNRRRLNRSDREKKNFAERWKRADLWLNNKRAGIDDSNNSTHCWDIGKYKRLLIRSESFHRDIIKIISILDGFLILLWIVKSQKSGWILYSKFSPPLSKKNIIVETFSHKFYFHTANKIFPPPSRIQMRKRKENVEKLLPTNPHPSMPVSSIKIDTQVYPS